MANMVHRSAVATMLGLGLALTAVGAASAAGRPPGPGHPVEKHCPVPLKALSNTIIAPDSLTGLCDGIQTG